AACSGTSSMSCPAESSLRETLEPLPTVTATSGELRRAPPPRLPRRRLVVATPLALVLLVFGSAWLFLFCSIELRSQNFPLADDWSFSRGAVAFARGGGVHYDGWPSMPLLGQWIWAAPFVWVAGASHVALRVSTIVLAGLGFVALWDLLRSVPGISGR